MALRPMAGILSMEWIAIAIAVAAYAVGALWSLRSALLIGWIAHGAAVLADILFTGDASVRFGFAPALAGTVWIVVGVHLWDAMTVSRDSPHRGNRAHVVLAGLAVASLLLMALFPGAVRAHATSAWMPLHWLLGIVAYGLVAVAVVHALWLDAADRRLRGGVALRADMISAPGGVPLLHIERLTFRFVEVGFVVLTLALALGWWLSPSWRWDHKAIFSVLSWSTLAALLVGRHGRGWRGRRATRWIYGAALLLLLAYIGSRFVAEVILNRGA
jgi:ABC-type uncharacterized transport system permease subunit